VFLKVGFFAAIVTHPQMPEALICNSTSPRFGSKTGASTIFNLWSAVACSDGFGREVWIMLPPFRAVAATSFSPVVADISGESPLEMIAGAIVLNN
jgi:hypothetical protein